MIKTIARLACCGFALLAIAGQNANADVVYDFLTDDGGFVNSSDNLANPWTWTNGTGWTIDGVDGNGQGQNNGYLTSELLVVTANGGVDLSFDHQFGFETDWDGGAIWTSVNGGAFTYLDASAFSAGGYNSVALLGNHVNAGLLGFNDISGSPLGSAASLGTFNAGDTLQIRFTGGWDEFVVGPGQPEWSLTGATVTNATAVPEPGTGLVLVFSGAMAFVGRRKR